MNACGVRISAYADGELGSAEAWQVEAHLATCARCAAELAAARACGSAIRNARATRLSDVSATRIREQLERAVELARWRRLERFAGALTAVAACLAIVGAIFAWQAPSPAEPEKATVAAVVEDPVLPDETTGREISTSEWMVAALSGTRVGGTYER